MYIYTKVVDLNQYFEIIQKTLLMVEVKSIVSKYALSAKQVRLIELVQLCVIKMAYRYRSYFVKINTLDSNETFSETD